MALRHDPHMYEVGSFIRYQGLGAGEIVDIVERPFRGQQTRFLVIRFEHREMQAQVPADDEKVREKLHPVLSARKLRSLLGSLGDGGVARILPRTWDHREELGKAQLNRGGPEEWIELLSSYALAERQGVAILFADHELIEQALTLLAAELACAERKPYAETLAKLKERYNKAAEPIEPEGEQRAHFGSVKVGVAASGGS